MKVLILSASTGHGHNKAGETLKKHFEETGSKNEVIMVDALDYISPLLNKVISDGYLYLATKAPNFYKKLYNLSNKENSLSTFVTLVNNTVALNLLPLIREFEPNVIITTHPFTTEMASRIKEKFHLEIPITCIMTDYAAHKTWIRDNVTFYIVSNDDMMNDMVKNGIEKEKIYSYGIPIGNEFVSNDNNNSYKKEICNDLNISEETPIILIMAGSFGVTKILDIYNSICNIEEDLGIIVITGKNKSLYDEFENKIKDSTKKTKLIYYTSEVHKYMKSSNLIITKPGGLTTTEALACDLPMIIFDAIPGQEEENADFLIKHNMAIKINSKESYEIRFKEIINDANKLNDMKRSCEKFNKKDSTKNIISLINTLK